MSVLGPADILDKVAKLLTESSEDLVLILDGF